MRGDVTDQARTQQQRAAGGLHGLAGELNQMADGTPQAGMAAGLAQQAAERVDGVAAWLENREPSDVLDDVRRYARRNPGTFLAVCAAVGFLGGRLTRGLRDDAQSQPSGAAGGYPSTPTYATPPVYDTTTYDTMPTPPASYGGRPSAGDPVVDLGGDHR